jgi:hypothetical protein
MKRAEKTLGMLQFYLMLDHTRTSSFRMQRVLQIAVESVQNQQDILTFINVTTLCLEGS